MMNINKAYVYVVCGSDKYISTLNTSLEFLRNKTQCPIYVITDLKRNTLTINHDNVIDVKTDSSFSDHQAAIYLKTSLHKYLNLDDTIYCYLDSDVVAINNLADSVFEQRFDIIGFCADNISFDFFSPYAVNCSCCEVAQQNKNKLTIAISDYEKLHEEWTLFCKNEEGLKLEAILSDVRKKKLRNIDKLISYYIQNALPFRKKIVLGKYYQDKNDKAWFNCYGKKILYPISDYKAFVSAATGFVYDKEKDFWTYPHQQGDVTKPRCLHLHEAINELFNMSIVPENWQHPNGGVFLFNKDSSNFLEQWHKLSVELFENPYWKTRDQGALAVVYRKFCLHKKIYLNSRYNFIIDYFCNDVTYDDVQGFKKKSLNDDNTPVFLHVFHHFGDTNWPLWKSIESFK